MRTNDIPKVWVRNWTEAVDYGTESAERFGFGAEIERHVDPELQTRTILSLWGYRE